MSRDSLLILAVVVVAFVYLNNKSNLAITGVNTSKPVSPSANPNGGNTQEANQNIFNSILGLISGAIGAIENAASSQAQTTAQRN